MWFSSVCVAAGSLVTYFGWEATFQPSWGAGIVENMANDAWSGVLLLGVLGAGQPGKESSQDTLQTQDTGWDLTFERAPVGMALCKSDGTILRANNTLARLLGRSQDELLGQQILTDTWPTGGDQEDQLLGVLHWPPGSSSVIELEVKANLIEADRPGRYVAVVQRRPISTLIEGLDAPIETFFGALFDKLPYPVVVTDAQRQIRAVNPSVERVFGYKRSALIGQSVSLIYEIDGDFEIQGRDRFKRETHDHYGPAVVSYKRASGEAFFGETVGRVVRGTNGVPIGFVGIITDITERQSDKEEIRSARFALEHIDEAVFWCSLDGRFSYVNQAACERLGYSREELLKLSLAEIDPDKTIPAWVKQLIALGADGSTVTETVHLHKNGDEIPVEVSAKLLNYGGQTLIFAFARDIRLRRESELALQRSEASIRLITDSIPVFIARVDRYLNYTFVNKSYERLFGRERLDIVGHPMAEILGDAEFRHIEEHVKRALNGETVGFERDLPNTALGRRHVRATLLPDTQLDGSVSGIFIFAQDATDAKESERALHDSEQRARHARAQLLDAIEIGRASCRERV